MAKIELGKDGRPARNLKNGRFLPGHISHNTGKKWDEWMPKEKQARVLEIGKKNLRVNPNIRGWNKRAVVAVNDKGIHAYCESAAEAARKLNLDRRNVTACCRGERNKCGGLRWFYYDDDRWIAYAKERRAATEKQGITK
jgi:hypothetical protein